MSLAATLPQPGLAKVKVRDLCLSFQEEGRQRDILDHVSLTVEAGQFVCIVGPSGCGKSTMLHVIGGFLPPTSGSIEIDGEAVRGPDPRRIFVFQESGVFPWLTVQGNIGFGLSHLDPKAREERVAHYIDLVGLAGFERAFPQPVVGRHEAAPGSGSGAGRETGRAVHG